MAEQSKELILVCGDMLFEGLPGLPTDLPILMVEDRALCERSKAHKFRLVLFLSGMRHMRDSLRREGRMVIYLDLTQRRSFFEALGQTAKDLNIRSVITYEINNHFFHDRLLQVCQEDGLKLVEFDNPMFLTNRRQWDSYASGSKKLLMANFYRGQRQRLKVLVSPAGEPTGGKWSFDEDNRKPLPLKFSVPGTWPPEIDEVTRDVIELVEREFPSHAGVPTNFDYPTCHRSAEEWLDQFLEERLDLFGDYEDALSSEHRLMFHSRLSPLLNCGLLTPGQVIQKSLERHRQRPVPLNSLEGFLRQIIGWREFVRGIYREYQAKEIGPNSQGAFGNRRLLKRCWWEGDTGLPPLDLVIRRAVDHGYAHHIERLMVAGSAMLMAGVAPTESYRWFMELFIDAADWVMAPNVIGMSQFADGALFATKPYISGSAYLLRMGKFEKGDWCEVWDGLYWRFISRNRDYFSSNPRTSQMVSNLDRLSEARKSRVFSAAEQWIDKVTSPPEN